MIGVFPNEDSVLRLMGSVLVERHDALLSGKAVFSKESLSTLMKSDVPAKLIVIAKSSGEFLLREVTQLSVPVKAPAAPRLRRP